MAEALPFTAKFAMGRFPRQLSSAIGRTLGEQRISRTGCKRARPLRGWGGSDGQLSPLSRLRRARAIQMRGHPACEYASLCPHCGEPHEFASDQERCPQPHADVMRRYRVNRPKDDCHSDSRDSHAKI